MRNITKEVVHEFFIDDKISLAPTQRRLCIPIINRIYRKMMHGLVFSDIRVCDELVIDGHHRYVAALLAKKQIESVQTQKSSATQTYVWADVELVNEDWDTGHKIHMLDLQDAEANNLPIEHIKQMMK